MVACICEAKLDNHDRQYNDMLEVLSKIPVDETTFERVFQPGIAGIFKVFSPSKAGSGFFHFLEVCYKYAPRDIWSECMQGMLAQCDSKIEQPSIVYALFRNDANDWDLSPLAKLLSHYQANEITSTKSSIMLAVHYCIYIANKYFFLNLRQF